MTMMNPSFGHWPLGRWWGSLCRTVHVVQDRAAVVPRVRIVIAAVLALAAASAPASAHAAEPRGPAGVVDVDMADDASEPVLRDEVTAWYDAQKVAIATMVGEGVQVRAAVRVRDFDPDQGLGYAGHLTVRLEDARGAEGFEIHAGCPCSAQEFFAAFDVAVSTRVGEWVRIRDEKLAAATAEPSQSPAQPVPRPPARYKMRFFGILGVIAMAAGAGAVVGGAVMWKRGIDAGEPPSRQGLGAAGVVAVTGGILLLGGGVASLVTEIVLDRRSRRSLRPTATLGPSGGGVGLRGRF